ncbi:MAG TPA: type II toxin-antitoxin system HicB family antitoxin [Bryobacteraceae bacterium]|jgi:predicted RNase H-like HicB family nuclease|nr:type II toxin-antitoxin system HicB family antitoxin [Bryobacteraceae bacterium]
MSKYAVVIEKSEDSYGAYVPDLPGCVAVGRSKAEVQSLIAEAIALHIESLREHGNPVPQPSSAVEYIEPAAVA